MSILITGATQANPCVITTSGNHNLSDYDYVTITCVNGMTQLNNNNYYVKVASSTTLRLYEDSSTYFCSS